MQEVAVSQETQRYLDKLMELYRQGKVFAQDKSVLKDRELREIIDKVILHLGLDTKNHLNITHKVSVTGTLIHNMKFIVKSCAACSCDWVLYDTAAGTCSYLGTTHDDNCV
jgi:hypothetical protein